MKEGGKGKINVEALIDRTAAQTGEFDAARSRAIAKIATPLDFHRLGAREMRRKIRVGEAFLKRPLSMEVAVAVAEEVASLKELQGYLRHARVPQTLKEKTEGIGELILSSRDIDVTERRLGLPKLQ